MPINIGLVGMRSARRLTGVEVAGMPSSFPTAASGVTVEFGLNRPEMQVSTRYAGDQGGTRTP
jgi:hypothetical protein